MLNILHITPHLGGGVGSVVLNWMMKDPTDTKHTIISLDRNNNPDWKQVHDNYANVTIYDGAYFDPIFNNLLMENIQESDIVLIHYWNHPLLYDVMINRDFPACRLIMWNHVSGLFPPYVNTEQDIDFCDKYIFTSPVSYEADDIKELSEEKKYKLDVNWSTIGVESFKNLKRPEHKEFIVGFTGTVDFGKLNPKYIDLCAAVNIPDVKFIVCSGDSQQHLIDEAKEKNVYERFSFEGRVPSIVPFVAQFDVFGYPLQPQNFATCEQAIGEAMMGGAVPVVLNNPPERYIVKHMETGIVANTYEEYSTGIEFLYKNPDKRKELQANAQKFASNLYDINNTINKWYCIFEEEMHLPKQLRQWLNGKIDTVSPEMLYILSLGNHAKPFKDYLNARDAEQLKMAEVQIKDLYNTNSMFYSKNKGSVLQYLRYSPYSTILRKWADLI